MARYEDPFESIAVTSYRNAQPHTRQQYDKYYEGVRNNRFLNAMRPHGSMQAAPINTGQAGLDRMEAMNQATMAGVTRTGSMASGGQVPTRQVTGQPAGVGSGGSGGVLPPAGSPPNSQSPFSDNLTDISGNSAASDFHGLASLPHAMKGLARPGQQADAGTIASALPQVAGGVVGADLARSKIYMDDKFDNMRTGIDEALNQLRLRLGMGNLGLRLAEGKENFKSRAIGDLMGALG